MRIRRLPGRGKSPAARLIRLVGRNGEARVQPAQPVLRKPTAASPLHPDAFYHWLGLHKYTTGLITLPPALESRIQSSKLALKVYSTEPMSPRNVKATIGTALRTSSVGKSLRTCLNQLFHVAASVYSSSSSIASVFFQTFERHAGRFDRHRTTSARRNRPWTLAFELFRYASGISKPLSKLDIHSIYTDRLCTIRGASLRGKGLSIAVLFHVKPSTLGPAGTTENHSDAADPSARAGPIQPLVDDMQREVFRSIHRLDFVNEEAMLVTIERAVLAYLRSSSLAPWVDFHHIELELSADQGERIVTNRYLNADGTEREARMDLEDRSQVCTSLSARLQARESSGSSDSIALPGPFPSELVDQDIRHLIETIPEPTIISKGKRRLSEVCQAKTGIAHIAQLSCWPQQSRVQQPLLPKPGEISEIFDSLLANAPSVGLACLAYTSALVASKFHDLSARLESGPLPIPISPSRHSITAREFYLALNVRRGLGWVKIRLPTLEGINFSICQTSTRTTQCKVYLTGRYQKQTATQGIATPQPETSTADEANVLAQMVSTVMEGLAKGLRFDSYEAVPNLLAQGLLRTVQFLSPSIILERVQVAIVLPEESPLGSCEIRGESWRQHDIENSALGGTLREDHSVNRGETSDDFSATENTNPKSDEAMHGSESGATAELTGSFVTHQELPTAIQEDRAPLRPNRYHDNTLMKSSGLEAFQGGGRLKESSKEELESKVEGNGNEYSMEPVLIALGSNLGDRLQNLEKACGELNNLTSTRVLRTSALYETAPMYVEDQDPFLNGVCEIETSLSPTELLDELQGIEQRLGRVKTIDKGPRNIDLDIILYRNAKIKTDRLTIPHPLMLEREFVLRPLCDIPMIADRRPRTGGERISYRGLLTRVATNAKQQMWPILTLSHGTNDMRIGSPNEQTRIMSIINVTPDSFSDGGLYSPTNLEHLKTSIQAQIMNGATIVDIGGQSSRPNAPDVTAEEEMSRILPAIEVIKSIPEAANVAISVDTYRAAVAEAAINAGAHIINDISAGMLDEDMLPTIARLGCTYVMMHMRGTPSTMMSEENCTYPYGPISSIIRELATRVNAAQLAGIRRWRIVLDPGIGFSKNADQNLQILRKVKELKQSSLLSNFAWLVGSSRKSFIGKVTGVEEPKNRGWGTAATVTAAIEGGADIVRVHDAAEMSAVVKMADAMYRVKK